MERHSLSVRRRTHIGQKLPEDCEEKLITFQRFIIRQRKRYAFPLSQIGNADQTPLTFDLPTNTSISSKGQKSVSIITTGNEKNRFTVMLACTADGGKLPPYVVFKRKTMPKGVKWPKGVEVRVQEKGWMDTNLVRDWIKTVWGRRPGGVSRRSLLVLDAFRAHTSDDVKSMLTDYKTNLAVIPGGMTCMLQPLDVSIKKPMKQMLQIKWNEWYCSGPQSFTAGGRRRRKPELEEICQWIVDCWQQLDPAIIQRAFKKCCISNHLDGTEDDILFKDLIKSRSPVPDLAADEDDESEDDETDPTGEETVYTDVDPQGMSSEEIARFFQSDDEESDFEGFDESDL
jgi:hypothetical protein